MSKTLTKAVLKFVRQTKGAVLYKQEDPSPNDAITNLYLRKSGLGDEYPNEIEVTIKAIQ